MAFVVAATWTAREGAEEVILDVIRRLTPLSRAEEGNLFYQGQVDPDSARRFFLYEQYTSAQAYQDHKDSEHFQELVINYALDFLEERQIRTFQTIEVGGDA